MVSRSLKLADSRTSGLNKTLAGSDNKDARTSANCYDKSKWKFSFNTVRITVGY